MNSPSIPCDLRASNGTVLVRTLYLFSIPLVGHTIEVESHRFQVSGVNHKIGFDERGNAHHQVDLFVVRL